RQALTSSLARLRACARSIRTITITSEALGPRPRARSIAYASDSTSRRWAQPFPADRTRPPSARTPSLQRKNLAAVRVLGRDMKKARYLALPAIATALIVA